MPSPGGGINSGGFGGGTYEGINGTTYEVPALDFDYFIDFLFDTTENLSNFWTFLHKPFYTALNDLMVGDGHGFLSNLFGSVFDFLSTTNFAAFFNQFSVIQFIFGSGLVILVSYSLLKYFKF